jgi:hypothetical protein
MTTPSETAARELWVVERYYSKTGWREWEAESEEDGFHTEESATSTAEELQEWFGIEMRAERYVPASAIEAAVERERERAVNFMVGLSETYMPLVSIGDAKPNPTMKALHGAFRNAAKRYRELSTIRESGDE